MTIERMQELSLLTEIAVNNNDIETLKKIKKIIELDFQISEYQNPEGDEWFYSMLTGEQSRQI
jgi:hypothetical protein